MKKAFLPLCVVSFAFLLSGCELFDIISNAIHDVWGSPSVVDVLVLPPLPYFDDGEDSNWNQRLANCDSEAIKRAMIRGVDSFNDGTKKTRINACYYSDKEVVKSFYEEVVLGALRKSIEEGSDAPLRQCYREFLRMLNNECQKSDGSRYNFKCLICGFYKFNRNATANNIDLIHYDIVKDDIATENGIVTKEAGSSQDSDLERLMTSLLKKAYGR